MPVPRSKKKFKTRMDCSSRNENIYKAQVAEVVPPKRTKKKVVDNILNANDNAEKNFCNEDINESDCKQSLCNENKICDLENKNVGDDKLFKCTSPPKEEVVDKLSFVVAKDKGPKIVKLIKKNSSELHDNNIVVNSNKVDNNVPKFKTNFCKKSVLGCGKFQRDSEDDSGVYFSDSTKVSPVKGNISMDIIQSDDSKNYGRQYTRSDTFCNTPQPNNKFITTSDSVDNKETNLGPSKNLDSSVTVSPFFSVLDSFEAETLSKFKEHTFGCCGINVNEMNKNGKPAVGESLNRYLQDLLNNSHIDEIKDESVLSVNDDN